MLEVDLNETIAEMIIRLANEHGKDVYSIVGNMSVILARKDLIRQTKCFICNEVEAAKFFGEIHRLVARAIERNDDAVFYGDVFESG